MRITVDGFLYKESHCILPCGRRKGKLLQLHSLLESLNVEVVFQQVPAGSYERGYLNVLEKIRQHLRGNESFVK